MFPSCFANLIGDAAVHAGAAAQDKPAVSWPPGSSLEQRVLKQFLPNIFGGCGAKPELPVLLGGKREGTHMGLIVYARRKVPGGDRRKVRECGVDAGGGGGIVHRALLLLEQDNDGCGTKDECEHEDACCDVICAKTQWVQARSPRLSMVATRIHGRGKRLCMTKHACKQRD